MEALDTFMSVIGIWLFIASAVALGIWMNK